MNVSKGLQTESTALQSRTFGTGETFVATLTEADVAMLEMVSRHGVDYLDPNDDEE